MKSYPKHTASLTRILMPTTYELITEIRSAGLSIGKGMYASENGYTVGQEPEEGTQIELKTHTKMERW